jgi:hypothetical protein
MEVLADDGQRPLLLLFPQDGSRSGWEQWQKQALIKLCI